MASCIYEPIPTWRQTQAQRDKWTDLSSSGEDLQWINVLGKAIRVVPLYSFDVVVALCIPSKCLSILFTHSLTHTHTLAHLLLNLVALSHGIKYWATQLERSLLCTPPRERTGATTAAHLDSWVWLCPTRVSCCCPWHMSEWSSPGAGSRPHN